MVSDAMKENIVETKKHYLHGCCVRADGSKDSFWTKEVEVRFEPARRERMRRVNGGLVEQTPFKVLHNKKWVRVWKFVKSGTQFIGDLPKTGEHILFQYS